MNVTIAGSGTVFLNEGRSQSCLVVEAGDETTVFDLGYGAVNGMLRSGLDPFSVDRVFFTHFHPDHTSDLVPLLFSMNYGTNERRTKTLHLCGPEPFREFWGSISPVWAEWLTPKSYPLQISELPLDRPSPIELPGFTLTWARAKHRPESVAYRLSPGGSGNYLVYTGDTEYSESVVELARRAHTLVIECSAPDDSPIPGHLTPSAVARVAREAGVDRVVLTHVFPATRELDLVHEVGKGFDGEILLAGDGMKLEV